MITIELQVERRPIERLIPRATNPRTHTPEQVAQMGGSDTPHKISGEQVRLLHCWQQEVLLDGKPIRSCVIPMSAAYGHEIITIEGLGTVDKPHAIQTAFIEEQALHCGFASADPCSTERCLSISNRLFPTPLVTVLPAVSVAPGNVRASEIGFNRGKGRSRTSRGWKFHPRKGYCGAVAW
jgi:hypothetical protein